MTSHSMRARRIASTTLAVALTLGTVSMIATSASADDSRSDTIYNSIPAAPAGSYPSQPFTAQQVTEFGDQIHFAGESRLVQTVTLGLNSWACQHNDGGACVTTPGATFSEPATLTFYAVGGTDEVPAVGDELGSITETFDMPYRPSADSTHCTGNQWYNAAKKSCHSGYRFTVNFDFSDSGLVLPDDVIVSVKYPTYTYGPGTADIATNSLNVDLVSDLPSVGTDVDPDTMFVNSSSAKYAGSLGPGTFSLQGDWNPYGLDLKITAAPGTTADEPAPYLNGFESGQPGVAGLSGVTKVAYGSDAMTAAAGCYYAEAPVTTAADATVVTRYAGYTNSFPDDGYTTDADFYLDANAAAGSFDWSSAVNGTDGKHQRDFIFTAGADGNGTWKIGVGNNAANTEPWITSYSVTPLSITESGWYTFEHRFFEKNGRLSVAMSVLDSSGRKLTSWTLGGNAEDKIPSAVGGNRYGWLVNNSYANLPIDNVRLNSTRPTNTCPDYFSDVHFGDPSYANIQWAGYEGISTGYQDGTYGPANDVIRKHMALFLYRLAGSPDFTAPDESPFADVATTDPSYKQIAWLADQGISVGYADHTFGGNNDVTRKEMALFLYRLAGSPDFDAPETSPFTDVATTDLSYKQIAWLADKGITLGFQDGTYGPNRPVTRAQMANFLHRFADNVG